MLESRLQKAIAYGFSDWRPGDQKVFISDNSKALRELGWAPSTSIAEGLNKLTDWCKRNEQLLADLAVQLGMPAQEPLGRGASWA
jgi:CDP-paratose 2-epimerase